MIHLNNIDYLVGTPELSNNPIPVYADEVIALISQVSAALLKSATARNFPDLITLGFWGRKANLQKLKNEFGPCDMRLGRGVCFHIAPSNIPINFAFSLWFGLLAGNTNIVRIPSKHFPQIDIFCDLLKEILMDYPELASHIALIRYQRNNDITAEFCKIADARMIWGGDRTINLLKTMPTSPRCIDITFSDRYSIAILDAKVIATAEEETILRLAENFYNDTWLMDQNACSSPQLIIWLNDTQDGRIRFWDAAYKIAQKRYQLQDAVAVDKYMRFCEEAISNVNIKSVAIQSGFLYREELKKLVPDIVNHRGKSGYFFEYSLNNLDELIAIITERYQTITYFGINPNKLCEQLINAGVRGIDRVVPVGNAMDIGPIWDGHDLIRELSRIITIV